MAARVESQTGGADDGAAPSIRSVFENDHMLGATEAIMWIACRRRFSHDTIQEHLRRRGSDQRRRRRSGQVSRPLLKRVKEAEDQLIRLIIGGVPAWGTLDDEGSPDHQKRVRVPAEFLKDGAYIELLSGYIWADPLLEKHAGCERPKYRHVGIDRDAFFKALATAEPRSQTTDRGNQQDTVLLRVSGKQVSTGEGKKEKTCPASTKRRGPRPRYNWAAFHAEVDRRDSLPVNQAGLERAMMYWCEETWGEDNCPGESTIRAQVSRYYPE